MSAATTNTPNLPVTPKKTSGAAEEPFPQQVDLPSFLGIGYGNYAVQPNNFLLSFVAHILVVAVALLLATYLHDHKEQIKQQVTQIFLPGDIALPPSKSKAGGGGGGGDNSKIEAGKGKPPKFKMDQIVPPTEILKVEHPKIEVEQSIVVPPSVQLPTSQINVGDPLSKALTASNGTGSGSGIGSGSGGGIGSGKGRGLGPGEGGGVGGGYFRVGGGVSAPKPIYAPEPEYSEEGRKAKYQGVVVVNCIVGADGKPKNLRVIRSLGLGLDEKALEAVTTWRFEPGKKDGVNVPVIINVEVSFNLY
jgi:protein TonB